MDRRCTRPPKVDASFRPGAERVFRRHPPRIVASHEVRRRVLPAASVSAARTEGSGTRAVGCEPCPASANSGDCGRKRPTNGTDARVERVRHRPRPPWPWGWKRENPPSLAAHAAPGGFDRESRCAPTLYPFVEGIQRVFSGQGTWAIRRARARRPRHLAGRCRRARAIRWCCRSRSGDSRPPPPTRGPWSRR